MAEFQPTFVLALLGGLAALLVLRQVVVSGGGWSREAKPQRRDDLTVRAVESLIERRLAVALGGESALWDPLAERRTSKAGGLRGPDPRLVAGDLDRTIERVVERMLVRGALANLLKQSLDEHCRAVTSYLEHEVLPRALARELAPAEPAPTPSSDALAALGDDPVAEPLAPEEIPGPAGVSVSTAIEESTAPVDADEEEAPAAADQSGGVEATLDPACAMAAAG